MASLSLSSLSRAYHDMFSHARHEAGRQLFPSAQPRPGVYHHLSTNNLLASALMSHSHTSNHFQLIINNALRAYEKRTKKDLLSHPLATQLQTCNSPGDILAVLHQQVQGLDQSRTANNRWTKWLDPTVAVLYTLSETLGEGVSLVSIRT